MSLALSAPPRRLRRCLPLIGVMVSGGLAITGDAIAAIALPWFVLSVTGSPLWTGIAAAAAMVPLAMGALLGGGIVDRLGPRRVAVTAGLVSAATVGTIPLLHHLDLLQTGTLIGLIALGAVLDGPGAAAGESRYPELARLAGLRLERVAAIDELIDTGTSIAGPALAGLLIALIGMENTLWATAGCSLLAAIIAGLSLPGPRRAQTNQPASIGLAGAREGLGVLLGDPLLRALMLLITLLVAIFGALDAVIMPAFLRATGRDVVDLAMFLSAAGVGALAGTLIYAGWGHRLRPRLLLLAGCAAEAGGVLVLGLAPPTPVLAAAGTIVGLAVGPLGPIANTAILRRIPVAMRGRTLGVVTALALAATPLTTLLAGALVEWVGAAPLLFSIAGLLALLTLLAARLEGLKELG